jgi:hypothetical protein
VLVNALATNLKLNGLDKDVTNPVEPAEGGSRGNGNIGELDTQVSAVDQITIAADGGCNFLGPIAQAIDAWFPRFPKGADYILSERNPGSFQTSFLIEI